MRKNATPPPVQKLDAPTRKPIYEMIEKTKLVETIEREIERLMKSGELDVMIREIINAPEKTALPPIFTPRFPHPKK